MEKTCSQAQFASLVGVSKAAVNKAIQSNRLSKSVIRDGSRCFINVYEGIKEWEGNRDVSKARGTHEDINYAEAKRLREIYTAKLLALDYEEKAGLLMRRTKVKSDFAEIATNLYQKLTSLPDQLAPALVNINEINIIRNLLQEKFESFLCDLKHSPLAAELEKEI
jgi:predicted transcriptional regulator